MSKPPRIITLLPLVPLLALGACVTSPEEGAVALGNPNGTLSFQGFASAPGATIELNILNKATDDWEQFATTVSSNSPIDYGGQTMYGWSVSAPVMDTTNPAHLCRLTSTCALQEATVFVQVEEVGGSFSPLMTFDSGGVACTMNEVNNGADLLSAAWTCKGAIHDRIAIPVIL